MFDDPRIKARSFLESSSIISELEDVLNQLVYEKPNDLHGYLANHFMDQCRRPQITEMNLRQLTGPAGEFAVHIDLTIALRNRTERHHGLTINLLRNKSNAQTIEQLESFIKSSTLTTVLNRIDLFDQITIDNILSNFRLQHSTEMAKLAAIEAEKANGETPADASLLKPPSTKGPTATSSKTNPPPPPASKKGIAKDAQPIEITPDEPEPFSFPGQSLITGISLSCRLITSNIQQLNLYRIIQSSPLTDLSLPLPIIPILQSGPTYPGKQAIIKYFMLIPTPTTIHNEEWINKLYNIIQYIRDSLTTMKGAIPQSSYSTDDGCLVYPMDKPEQGFDFLQNAVNNICGTDEHWFDYAVQMGPYETFDYTRGKHEIMTGVAKTPDELIDVYTEWIDTYPRCIMLIDPFRHADKVPLGRLCDRISNRCYITSTDVRRYQDNNDDNNTINCHLLNFDKGPTINELIQRVNTVRENNNYPLGLYERDHQELAQVYLADLAIALGCRFIKVPGILSLGGQTTSSILQRLSIIRDEIEMNNNEQLTSSKQHEFIHIRLPIDPNEPERIPSPTPTNAKNKDKKKRP